MSNLPDIYFTPEYGRLYEVHEGGVLESFTYTSGRGEVNFQFIRRPLGQFSDFSAYSDIITPYGYGGPVYVRAEAADKPALALEFKIAFHAYCREKKIVTAFVRFHPLVGNAADFKDAFDEVLPIRKTVAIDLTKDLMNDEINSDAKRSYKAAVNKGVTIQYDTALATMEHFISLYYRLMDRKKTSSYYFFPKEYFYEIKKLTGHVELVNALLDGEIIATVLYLKYGKYIHTHLTASTLVGNQNRAVEFIKVSRALLAKDEGILLNHLGGGITNDPEDSLYKFKKKFSRGEPLDFYIGKSIYDQAAYQALCAEATRQSGALDEQFFPKYRSHGQVLRGTEA